MNNLPYEILVTDVDGVLTNGKYLYDSSGKCFKEFGAHDADGVNFFKSFGVDVVAISADKRGFKITEKRLCDMNVELHLVSETDRLSFVKSRTNGVEFAFIGDGYFDIPVLEAAKVGYSPDNAIELVKKKSDVILPVVGGNGVLLAVFEHFLSIHNSTSLYQKFLKGELGYG